MAIISKMKGRRASTLRPRGDPPTIDIIKVFAPAGMAVPAGASLFHPVEDETSEHICDDIQQFPRMCGDMAQLYRRMAFNAFCNNSDDHLRNHRFLFDAASRE